MKLNKTQINYIEKRLVKAGVKYWDIRIELLDHIVSELEHNLKNSNDFKKEVQNSLISFGYNGSFEKVVCERLRTINKKIRKKYFKEVVRLFQKRISLITMTVLFFMYFYVYQFLNTSVFKYISLFLLFAPFVIFLTQFTYILLKREKSGILLYGNFYVFLSFLILNMFIQLTKPEKGFIQVPEANYKFIIFIVTVVNSTFTFAGLKVYLNTLRYSKKLYQKLNSI